MHPDAINRSQEETKIAVSDVLTAAVTLLRPEEDQAGSEWERGITELVARVGYDGNYEDAYRAIKDHREEIEQAEADELERAEADFNSAAARLAEVKAKQGKQ